MVSFPQSSVWEEAADLVYDGGRESRRVGQGQWGSRGIIQVRELGIFVRGVPGGDGSGGVVIDGSSGGLISHG
jgi:hypothetical protein